jgi:PAS domain S-box-containing protein
MSKEYTESQLRQLMLVARQRRAIAELEHEYVSLAQEDGQLVYVNEAYSRLFDCAPDQLLGLNLYALMPPEEREAVRTRVELALRGEAVIDSANPVLDGAGRMVWIAWHNSLQIGPTG